MNMNISELKNYLSTLPSEMDTYTIVFVDKVTEIENASNGNFLTRHKPIVTSMINLDSKELCFFDLQQIEKFDKLSGISK